MQYCARVLDQDHQNVPFIFSPERSNFNYTYLGPVYVAQLNESSIVTKDQLPVEFNHDASKLSSPIAEVFSLSNSTHCSKFLNLDGDGVEFTA